MVYQDVETGEIWSRKLINFLAANTQIDLPELPTGDMGKESENVKI